MDFLYKSLNMLSVGGNSGVDPRLIAAIKKVNKIDAIKVYRELTNVGLTEAKTVVEEMWSKH